MQVVREDEACTSWLVVQEPSYVVEVAVSSTGEVDRWRLVDVEDVEQVLDWVRRHHRDRVVSVFVQVEDEQGLTLVQLVDEQVLTAPQL